MLFDIVEYRRHDVTAGVSMTHTQVINVNLDASDQFTCSDTDDQFSGDTGDQCTGEEP